MRAVAVVLAVAFLLGGCLAGNAKKPAASAPLPYANVRCAGGDALALTAVAAPGNGTRCNVRLTGNPPGDTGPANELTIAVDPTNPDRILAGGKDYKLGPDPVCGGTRVWMGYYYSGDGGKTWGSNLMPGHDLPPTSQPQNPGAGYHCTSDPVVGWDGQGVAYFSGLNYAQADTPAGQAASNVYLAKSHDGGKTFDEFHVVFQSDGLTLFNDKQWFAIDPRTNVIYVTWSLFVFQPTGPVPLPTPNVVGQNQIVVSRSTDGGTTWTPPRILYETQATGVAAAPAPEFSKQYAMPAVDGDGKVYVVWRTDDMKVWLTSSTDQGTTWSDPRVVYSAIRQVPSPLPPTAFRADSYPVLAIDRSSGATRGSLYLAYASYDPVTKADVYVTRSRDGGVTWTGGVRVNDDRTATDQWMPWIDVGPKGDVHVVWLDRRNDPGDRLYDAYYAHSTDGSSFGANVRLSEASSNSTYSKHQTGRDFVGDYIGVAAGSDGAVHPIWPDTRAHRAEAYSVTLTP